MMGQRNLGAWVNSESASTGRLTLSIQQATAQHPKKNTAPGAVRETMTAPEHRAIAE
jgi:hypothetical protein